MAWMRGTGWTSRGSLACSSKTDHRIDRYDANDVEDGDDYDYDDDGENEDDDESDDDDGFAYDYDDYLCNGQAPLHS